MTVEFSNYLIGLEKHIIENDKILDSYLLDIKFPMSFRLTLISNEDLDQSLLIDIKESEKKALKISLHHQDNNTLNGILRIDYNGRHLNPHEIIPTLPEIFSPFAGQWLDDYSGHIHYVVNGYAPLAWAIPLEIDEFPIKKIVNYEDYPVLLSAFFKKINLKTAIKYNQQMKIQ